MPCVARLALICWDDVQTIFCKALSGGANRVQDELHRFVRTVPHREMPALGEPVQLGGRECLLSASSLPRQTKAVLAAPANDDRARRVGSRPFLFGADRKWSSPVSADGYGVSFSTSAVLLAS